MEEAEFYLEIINHLSDGIYYVDQNRTIRFWNRGAEALTGYTAEEMLGKPCQLSLLNHIDAEGRPLCRLSCPLFKTLSDGETRTDQVLVRHKDGYRVPIRVTAFPIVANGEIQGAVEVFSRTTTQVYEDRVIDRLSDVAMHDTLTQLPNRRYLESFMQFKMQEVQRFHQNVAILFGDVDRFSSFNNTYGHDAGDAVLQNVAASIRNTLRKNDMVGRWGGEEFLGVCTVTDQEDASILGEKFRSLVENTEIVKDELHLHTTISVGITLFRPDDTLESAVKRADTLMYQSKRRGRNCVTVG